MRRKPRSRRPALIAALLGFALVAAAACGGTPAEPVAQEVEATSAPANEVGHNLIEGGTAEDGGTLVAALKAETTGWNPHQNEWPTWSTIAGSSFLEPLAVLDADGVAQPWLATSFTPNDTFDVWTIQLRDDVTFHNGQAFDAEAVKQNLYDAMMAPLTAVVLAGAFSDVSAEGSHTVKVTLAKPWAAFPTSFLASQTAFMMAPAMLDEPDGGQKEPIGTGPFAFLDWTPGDSLTLEKNTTYWREGEPHLDRLEFRVIGDPLSQRDALEAGDVDVIFSTGPEGPDGLDDSFQMVKNWANEPAMLITNTLEEVKGQPNPLANRHARLALAHATDRQAIADEFGMGVPSPTSPFAADSPWGQPDEENGYPDFDPEQAKAELELYKEETGANGLSVVLTGDPVETTRLVQVLQAQWQAVGIESTVETIQASAFIGQAIVGGLQLAIIPIYTSPDPDQNWYFWSSTQANGAGTLSINFAQLKSDAIDEALLTGRESADPAVRKAAYSDLVQELNREAVNLWLYWTPHTLIANDRVRGLEAVTTIPFADFNPKTWWGQLRMAS